MPLLLVLPAFLLVAMAACGPREPPPNAPSVESRPEGGTDKAREPQRAEEAVDQANDAAAQAAAGEQQERR